MSWRAFSGPICIIIFFWLFTFFWFNLNKIAIQITARKFCELFSWSSSKECLPNLGGPIIGCPRKPSLSVWNCRSRNGHYRNEIINERLRMLINLLLFECLKKSFRWGILKKRWYERKVKAKNSSSCLLFILPYSSTTKTHYTNKCFVVFFAHQHRLRLRTLEMRRVLIFFSLCICPRGTA